MEEERLGSYRNWNHATGNCKCVVLLNVNQFADESGE